MGAAKASYSPAGNLISGGTDLNMEGGVTDYFKDVVIVTCGVLLLSLLSDYFWFVFLVLRTTLFTRISSTINNKILV